MSISKRSEEYLVVPLIYCAALLPNIASTIMNMHFLNLPILERVQRCKVTLVTICFSLATLELAGFIIATIILATVFNCDPPSDSCVDGVIVLFAGFLPTCLCAAMYGQALLYFIYVRRLRSGAYIIARYSSKE